MFKEMASLASILKTAGDLRQKMDGIAEQLKGRRVVGSSGGGMVEVSANGLGEILQVKIDPALVERGEREMIEDLLPAAINHAISRAKELHLDMTRSAADGFSVPGLDDALAKLFSK